MTPRRRKMLAIGLVVAVVAVPLLIKATRGESSKEVDIAVAAAQDIRPTILASGVLAYLEEVKLTSELVAKVRSIEVEEGDRVQKGQLLLTLDPETYRNAIEREQASRRQSAISIERQKLALALAEKKFARGAQLREQQMIGETAIPSTNACAGASLMTIADTSAIRAELKVDEADIARIAVGQQVDVYATAFPDTALKGEVQRIALAPTLENQARAYEVIALLDPPKDLALRSGMSARADIFLGDGTQRLAVPVEAVATEEDEDGGIERSVWVERDGVAQRVVVQTGLSDDRWEEITAGLKAGDRVITGPARTLRGLVAGDRVRQRETAGADAKGGGDGKADGADDAGEGDDAETGAE